MPLISLTPLVMLVMMMRWSEFAFVGAIVGGLSYCFACEGEPAQYLAYCLGNLLGLLTLLIIRKIGKEEIRKKPVHLVLIAVSTYLFISVGRWLVSLIFEPTFATLPTFITVDIISLVVAIVGLISLRKSDGVIEDQKEYLLRLDRERRQEDEYRSRMASHAYSGREDEEDGEPYPEDEPDIIWADPTEELPEPGYAEDIPEAELPEPGYAEEILPEEELSAPSEDNNNDEFNSEDKI